MKTRHVFSTPNLETAQAALAAAREAGVEDNDLLLVARSDIELESIPDNRQEADTDLMPAALRGAGYGGATGLLAGLVAFAIPPPSSPTGFGSSVKKATLSAPMPCQTM